MTIQLAGFEPLDGLRLLLFRFGAAKGDAVGLCRLGVGIARLRLLEPAQIDNLGTHPRAPAICQGGFPLWERND